jgi:hypothetical protein
MARMPLRTSLAALAVAGVATAGLAAVPAAADSTTGSGKESTALALLQSSCKAKNKLRKEGSINFAAHYHNSSRYHVFTKFSWTIAGSVGNKNNVEIRVKHDNTAAKDHVYWTWISPDNIRKGYSEVNSGTKNGGNPVPRNGVRVPKNRKAYVEYKAIFDMTGPDPSCKRQTNRI